MDPEEYIQQGDLDQALSRVQEEIRRNPSKHELRIFLFQLLSVLGKWDKAMTQLNVAAEMQADSMILAQVCRPALQCEALRAEVFAGKRSPLIFGEPAEWIVWLTQALPLLAEGESEAASRLRDKAFEAAPEASGKVDDHEFAWIADADPRMGPVLEVILNGKYYWIPFSCIRQIQIDKPAFLKDVVWISAQFTWTNGGEAPGLIPARYPGSELYDDHQIKLGRRTEWVDVGHGAYLGIGQRMLTTDQDDYPLLSCRTIIFHHPDREAPGAKEEVATSDG